MYRGRLINPFIVRLYALDTALTTADPDAGGPLTSGYDPILREPRKLPQAGQTIGTSARRETVMPLLRAQVETVSLEKQRQMAQGNAPVADMVLVFHFRDLERAGLVDATTGKAKIQQGYRLDAILDPKTEALVRSFPNPPGLFAVRVEDEFGGLGRRRNLLKVYFKDRAQAVEV